MSGVRTFPWPKLLLVGLLGSVLTIGLLLVRWDPRTPLDQLETTAARLDGYEQVCSERTKYSDRVCHNVAHFFSDRGRRFSFSYADLMRDFREKEPVELLHTSGGQVWAVRQDERMVASYEAVREERSQQTRVFRFFGLLGTCAVGVVAARLGIRRLRAGPPCPSPLCRILDYATLGALVVASPGILLRDLTVAMLATLAAFVCFVAGIGWAVNRGHIDDLPFDERVLLGPSAQRASQAKARFDRWSGSLALRKESLTPSCRALAAIRTVLAVPAFFWLFGLTNSTLMLVVIPGKNGDEWWPDFWLLAACGAVPLAVALALTIALHWAARREDEGRVKRPG